MFKNNEYFIDFWDWISSVMTIEVFIKLVGGYFFLVWISIIIWVIRDVTNRTDSIILQFISILIIILGTPLGIFLYLLIRPTRTLFEKYYEEVEQNLDVLTSSIIEKVGGKKKNIKCPSCDYSVDSVFKFCPNCKEELKFSCRSCNKKIDTDWKVCAHCGKKEPGKEKKAKEVKNKEIKEGEDK